MSLLLCRSSPLRASALAALALEILSPAAGAQWNATEEAQLQPSAPDLSSWFGSAVAISGDTAVVGAQEDSWGGFFGAGSAFVFVRSGATWTEQAVLRASDAATADHFGCSVAIDGDTVIVGAYQDNHTPGVGGSQLLSQGSAYVFERVGTSWTERVKLTAGDAQQQDRFGTSVTIRDGTIVVGAMEDEHGPGAGGFSGQGSAYVFVGSGGSWSEQDKLTASDGAGNDCFGVAVVVSGDRAVVGAWLGDTPGGFDQGAAYVFERSGASWSETAKLTADDGTNADHFGNAVSVSGDTLLIGAEGDGDPWPLRGSAYVFVQSGASWSQQAKLLGKGASQADQFGFSVAVLGDVALIGAPFDDPPLGFNNAGSSYLFQRAGTAWTQKTRIIPPDSAKDDQFGRAVALDGDTALVGTLRSNALGKTYVYRLSSDPVTYCTSGTSASGCQAWIAASGTPSATAPSGFDLLVSGVEGQKRGLFYFGTSGRQANPWGGGSSYQCVVPPVARTPLLVAVGTSGSCDAGYAYDLNAFWTLQPARNPGPGALVDAQFWYRDPFNPSGQQTSISDAIEFCTGP